MSNRSGWYVPLNYLAVPIGVTLEGSEAGSFYGVTGPDIPAELVTYFAGFGLTVVTVDIRRKTTGEYYFDALVQTGSGDFYRSFGYRSGGVTGEHYRVGGTDPVGPTFDPARTTWWGEWMTLHGIASGANYPLGRGFRPSVSSVANSAAIGTTETVSLSNSFTFKDGRTYAVICGSQITASLSTNVGIFRIRKTNAAGTLWWAMGAFGPSGAPPNINSQCFAYLRRAAGAGDLTATVCLTLQASSSGTVTHIGSTTTPRYMHLRDITDFDTGGQFAFT